MDPYEPPPDPEERLIEIALDSGTSRTRSILWFCGVVYILIGILSGPLMSLPLTGDPNMSASVQVAILVGFSAVSCVAGVGMGVVNLVAAWGLGQGGKWAWFVAVGLGALYLPSGCLPFGAVMLYSLVNEKTRRLFLG
ncbi:MAG: hypothetical protein R3F59_09955 [Myxococcota bacterium]